MTGPKQRFRGQAELGRAIDERQGRGAAAFELRHDTGSAPAAPSAGDAGGSSGDPAFPESCVTSLCKSGEDALDGALEIAGAEGTTISQSSVAPHFTISSPAPLWQRDGITLSPEAAGDRLAVVASNSLGTIQATALGTDSPAITCDATSGYAVIARSTANLGVKLDGVVDIKLLDLAQVSAAPSGYGRWHALSDGRAYLVDETGNRHDLTAQHKQCFAGQVLARASGGETWQAAAYPAGATAAAITASPVCQFDFTSGGLEDAFGRWGWQASYTPSPPELVQAQVATGVAFRKYGDGQDRDGNCRVVFKARLRVNDPVAFDSIRMFIHDPASNYIISELLPLLAVNTWIEVTLAAAGNDISSWDANLCACIWAQGKQHTEEGTYPTTIDIEWLSVEQWVN